MKKQDSSPLYLKSIFLFLIIIASLNSTAIAKHKWTISDIMKSVINGNSRTITFLINNEDTNPHLKDFRIYIILMTAADIGHKKFVQLLLQSKNIHLKEGDLLAALMLAVEQGHQEIVQLLIDFELNINLKDKNDNNQTALMIAVENGHKDIVQLLINSGANMDLQNNYGQTALMIAINKEQQDIFQLLIDSGADVKLQDIYGRDALKLAFSKNNTKMTNKLTHLTNLKTNMKKQQNNTLISDGTTIYNQLLLTKKQGQSCLEAFLRKKP